MQLVYINKILTKLYFVNAYIINTSIKKSYFFNLKPKTKQLLQKKVLKNSKLYHIFHNKNKAIYDIWHLYIKVFYKKLWPTIYQISKSILQYFKNFKNQKNIFEH